MVAAIVFAFVVGVSVGILIGRRVSGPERPARPELAGGAPRAPAPTAPLAVPNKRARKAGLTEDAFRPADDILERLRLVAEGELDPAALADSATAEPSSEPPAAPSPEEQLLANPQLSDAERRVLERLRREAQADDGDTTTFS